MTSSPSTTRRISLFALVIILASIGLGQTHCTGTTPTRFRGCQGPTRLVWSIEARIQFFARGDAGYGQSATTDRPDRLRRARRKRCVAGLRAQFPGRSTDLPTAQWTVREASGRQTLYYRAEILQRENGSGEVERVPPPPLTPRRWQGLSATAAEAVLDQAVQLSADPYSLTRQLIQQFRSSDRAQNEQLLIDVTGEENLTPLLADLLQSRGIPAATVYGLLLEDGRRRQQLKPLLRVWSDDGSEIFPVSLTEEEQDLPLILWQPTEGFVHEVTGGFGSDLSFSMLRSDSTNYGQVASALGEGSDWLGFSIHALPIEEQAMFKSILLLPIGALVVCLLRILVGIRTSGTFMPVLIALAFIETSLVTGLIGFLLVVAVGLMIRSYMSHLNLLLVARISAVIITVITIIALFSVFSYRVGLTEGLKITFFPMIILSWTVERMSILWEEEGWREVAVQGSGSLITAVAAYLAMTNPWIRHLSFNFIGLQFVVLALIMLIGSYSGYRLLELWRFKPFAAKADNA